MFVCDAHVFRGNKIYAAPMAGTRAHGGDRNKQSGGSDETKRREFPGREGDDGGFDPSTSILESRLKNSVVVKDYQEILPQEVKPYEIWINTEAGEGIGLEQYGPVKVLGKKQRVNVLAVKFDRRIPEKSVVLSYDARKNLRVKINDVVKLYGMSVKDVPRASKVAFYPVQEGEKGTEDEDIFEMYIKPFFDKRYIFITAGNVYRMKGDKSKEFKVMKVMAYEGEEEVVKEYGIVEKDSTFVDGEGYVEKKDVEKEMSLVGYDDIGGCRKQIAKIRELIELPLKQPELFTKIGMKPPRGILLHGPPGTGKTLIAKAIANETGAYLHIINGPEIMSKMSGESESNLRKAFEEAEKNAPAIIFMDEIDSIAPNRDKTQGEVEKRIVSQLLTLMDGIKSSANVIVLAATNRPNSIDPALRRFGRFDRELEISVPDILGRLEILGIHTKNMNLDPDVDLMEIAKDIHGFTGSDIASLCSEAALQQIREKLPYIDLDREALDPKIISSLRVNASNFRFAISNTDPSSLRETVIETPNVSWTDIGGLEGVKMELKETVQYPVNFPEKFLHFGQNPSKGVLLYGPPGCGKTLLAKAVATECNANFISVKGPELLNMYVGESESNVRQLFDKARGSAPCVLFFDEIDSIGRSRSASSNDGGVSNNVLNQLLAEMDGMNQKKNVFVIGATNRPDQLDSALMRPGRLDQLVYIPLPDARSRASILRAKLSKTPIESDVSITEIANRTTGFSAADLSEVCQRAAKLAIRESIEAEIKDPGNRDAVRSLSKRHFEEALSQARRSVSSDELERFEAFARSMKVDIKHQNDMQDDVLYD